MGIRQITPDREIESFLNQEIQKKEKVVINVLNRVGLQCLAEARENGSYIDRTGNLRSSIGYAVLRNGQIEKRSSFKKVRDGSKGKRSGSSFIKSLASKYESGLVLVVVAGMEYAAYVETKRNVLTSSEILAEQLVGSLLQQLGFEKK